MPLAPRLDGAALDAPRCIVRRAGRIERGSAPTRPPAYDATASSGTPCPRLGLARPVPRPAGSPARGRRRRLHPPRAGPGRAPHRPPGRRKLPRRREGAARARVARGAGLEQRRALGVRRLGRRRRAARDAPTTQCGSATRSSTPSPSARIAHAVPDALPNCAVELAPDHRPRRRRARARMGSVRDDAARAAPRPGRTRLATLHRLAHEFFIARRDRRAARGCEPARGRRARPRLGRRLPDRRHAP